MYGESDSFLESGAGGANLDVNQATGRSLASLLGVRLTGNNLLSGNTTLIPHARIAWQHEFLDQIWSVIGLFAGQSVGSAFTVRGTRLRPGFGPGRSGREYRLLGEHAPEAGL